MRAKSTYISLSFDAGQELKDQVLHMLPASVILGRVLDEDGDPMPNVEVAGLTIVPGSRVLYAATHGLGAWSLQLP